MTYRETSKSALHRLKEEIKALKVEHKVSGSATSDYRLKPTKLNKIQMIGMSTLNSMMSTESVDSESQNLKYSLKNKPKTSQLSLNFMLASQSHRDIATS